jgi:hypothetical protein
MTSEELAPFETELAGVERRVERHIDPGATALGVSVGVLMMLASLMLTWTGSTQGWEVLAGIESFGLLPRLFAFTAVGFGVVGSALALATRRWGWPGCPRWAVGSPWSTACGRSGQGRSTCPTAARGRASGWSWPC